jgi:NADH dehydrogenase [ubiquinone] 1 alpha subcomplex assembly factor 1
MLKILALLLLFFMNQETLIYKFSDARKASDWQIINDGVMGGLSKSDLQITKEGNGLFSGQISLKNYGGFASMRYRFDQKETSQFSKFVLKIKGDKKRYQFRVKRSVRDAHSYIYYFETNEEWQDIEIPFDQMYASFRGQRLNYPNFPGEKMQEISFLIGNKKEENFILLIDNISLK